MKSTTSPRGFYGLVVILLSLFLMACAKSGNEPEVEAETENLLQPDMHLLARGLGVTEIFVNFKSGAGHENRQEEPLIWGEELRARAEGQEEILTERVNSSGSVYYYAQFDTENENTDFNVSFFRFPNLEATESIVRLPLTYRVLEPYVGQIVNRQSPLTVTWDPPRPGQVIHIEVFTLCYGFNDNRDYHKLWRVADTGSYTFDLDTMLTEEGIPASVQQDKVCRAALLFRRHRGGKLDPTFSAGGEIGSAREKWVELQLTGM